MDHRIIPTGKQYGLTVRHAPMIHTGAFIAATPKIIWHTTQSPTGRGTKAMENVLRAKGAEPHIVIDPGTANVVQLIPFDNFARALEHPPGTPDTNRAHAIQVEIVGYAEEAPGWSPARLRNLAALALLIEHRVGVRRRAPVRFERAAHRVGATAFLTTAGHLGHGHVPNQPTGHWDPGALDIQHIFRLMAKVAA